MILTSSRWTWGFWFRDHTLRSTAVNFWSAYSTRLTIEKGQQALFASLLPAQSCSIYNSPLTLILLKCQCSYALLLFLEDSLILIICIFVKLYQAVLPERKLTPSTFSSLKRKSFEHLLVSLFAWIISSHRHWLFCSGDWRFAFLPHCFFYFVSYKVLHRCELLRWLEEEDDDEC